MTAVVGEMPFSTPPQGLDAAEIAQRIAVGDTNATDDNTSRTLWHIVRANVMTRFNAILGTMFVVIAITGAAADGLFGVVLVANALIGIVQEYLAKRKLDALAVLSAPRAHAVRNGAVVEIMVEAVVLDDLLELRTGDQVCADGIVVHSDGVEIDESLLTGESDPVLKLAGDEVLSGSIVVAGHGQFQATRVGDAAYARKLAAEARRFSVTVSELQRGTNQILGWVTWALVPLSGLLLWSQLRLPGTTHENLPGVVAGIVAMVPEGLVLLTSFAFLLAARELANRNVLVQELPAVEGLARVDVVCVDKTGTITQGSIAYHSVEVCGSAPFDEIETLAALGAIAVDANANATAQALADALADPGWNRIGAIPFSSARKWSAAEFSDRGSWYFGAPEILGARFSDDGSDIRERVATLAATGQRVVLLAWSPSRLADSGTRNRDPTKQPANKQPANKQPANKQPANKQPAGEMVPGDLVAVALVMFEEQIRADAAETFAYFCEQGVMLRVISGDNPITVGAVAQRAGIPEADRVFDARDLPENIEEIANIVEEYAVFGRVTPHQKRAMVQALQSRGHVVAMTGDGVNDALALKDADIGVAMGSGAAATRAVAQLVLLDGQFARMPGVVAEGRRVIANVERVSNLYVTKTVYATLIALVVGVARWKYPFLPRHMTVVSTLTIGVPSFFLALGPSSRRYVPGFVRRVLAFTVPTGLVAGCATMACYGIVRRFHDVGPIEAASLSIVVLLGCGIWVLFMLSRPLDRNRALLLATMTALFGCVIGIGSMRRFYAMQLHEGWTAWLVAVACTAAAVAALELTNHAVSHRCSTGGTPVGHRTQGG